MRLRNFSVQLLSLRQLGQPQRPRRRPQRQRPQPQCDPAPTEVVAAWVEWRVAGVAEVRVAAGVAALVGARQAAARRRARPPRRAWAPPRLAALK